MANYQSHFSFATVVSVGYACVGIFALHVYAEQILLAAVIVVIAGMLPDIDANDGEPVKEFGILISAIVPIILLETFPTLKAGGVSRIALVVICCYVVTRLSILHMLRSWTTHRGLIHSIPAAIIVFELVYLLFWDLYMQERLYLGCAALVGYLSHLLVDAYGNFDIVGKATGKAKPGTPVLKFFGKSASSTIAIYTCVIALGWFVAKDIFPGLQLVAGVSY